MNKYLSIDTETGGLGLDTSLLTLGLIVADEDFNITQTINLAIKPDDGIYRVCGKALEVNKIDLAKHDLAAYTYKDSGTTLYKLLSSWTENGKTKLEPIGKQMSGDIAQIHDKLMSRNTWENFVSYRHTDISAVANFMMSLKILPQMKGSLSDLANHYKISTEGLHDSLADAKMTLAIYKAMVEHMKVCLEYTQ